MALSQSAALALWHRPNELGAVRFSDPIALPKRTPSKEFTHRASLTIYVTPENNPSLEELEKITNLAQSRLSRCQIFLDVDQKILVEGSPEFSQWESLEFNEGYLSEWERQFFSQVPLFSAGGLFVDSLDWTIGDDGIVAVGYGPFVLDSPGYFKGNEQDRQFYQNHMAGHFVLGKARSQWTFLHEVGHALMNLQHTEYRDNVMFPDYGDVKKINPTFSEEQCQQGRSNAPYVRPLIRH